MAKMFSVGLVAVVFCGGVVHAALLGALGTWDEGEYDFIVVGAGSAGSVIANRLSANNTYTVLLIEAGGEPDLITEIPAATSLMYVTGNAWRFKAEKQDTIGSGLKENRVPWIAGKGLGGTTLVNYMMHVRGQKGDYDSWGESNPGWTYEEVLPYFKKSENCHLPVCNPEYRSQGGPLDVGLNPYRYEFVDDYIKGANQIGLKTLDDYNDGHSNNGVGYLQSTLRNGRRCHAEKAFLRDIRGRKNLHIKTHSLVTKVLIDAETKTAQGVLYEDRLFKHKATARREVILSAGSYRSPQILMLSGVGPKEHLEEFGIPVVEDLPVGETLYDHPTFVGLFFHLNDSSVVAKTSSIINLIDYYKFLIPRTGPLTIPTLVIESVGMLNTNITGETPDLPDMELIQASGSAAIDLGLFFRNEFGMNTPTFERVFGPYLFKPTWCVLPMLYKPKSKGKVRLASTDPSKPPSFIANYFSDADNLDMKRFMVAIRTVQKISQSPALQRLGSTQVMTPMPGCEDEEVDSDSFWECQVRSVTNSLWHQVGVCKMGPKDDPEAVVDNELRVHGMKHLRVVDAGVIPRPMSVHTSIPSIMIGEKASDLILAANRGGS